MRHVRRGSVVMTVGRVVPVRMCADNRTANMMLHVWYVVVEQSTAFVSDFQPDAWSGISWSQHSVNSSGRMVKRLFDLWAIGDLYAGVVLDHKVLGWYSIRRALRLYQSLGHYRSGWWAAQR